MLAAAIQDPQLLAALGTVLDASNAWDTIRNAETKNGKGARLLTATGVPLTPVAIDAVEGELIGNDALKQPVHSRGVRYDVGDVEWSESANNGLYRLLHGEVGLSPIANDAMTALAREGIDLRKMTIPKVREALRSKKAGKILRALCPASLDEASSLFLTTELIAMLPDIVEIQRLPLFGRQLFPMKFLNAPGATDYEFSVMEDKGAVAQFTGDFSGKVPLVDIGRAPIRRPLRWAWLGCRYSWLELKRWQQARSNGSRLPDFAQARLKGVRQGLLKLENTVLFFGGPDGLELRGIVSPENGIQKTAAGNKLNTFSPNDMLKIVSNSVARVVNTAVETPDTIAFGTADYVTLGTTMYDTGQGPTGKTVLQALLENLKQFGITDIVRVPELQYRPEVKQLLIDKHKFSAADAEKYAGGFQGADVMLTYTRDPDKLAGVVGQDVMQFPPDVTSTETEVKMAMSMGGMEVRYPASADIVTFKAP